MIFDITFVIVSSEQVSLRDPIRDGADDDELRQIIGAAVCFIRSHAQYIKS